MSTSSIEPPVAWRVAILPANGRPFDREFRPKPQFVICRTQEEAEREKERQKLHFGPDGAVVHVQPLYVSKANRTRQNKAAQISLDDAGWPIQKRPSRPGRP